MGEFVEGMSWQEMAAVATEIAEQSGEWAGSPVPIDGLALSIAPGFSFSNLDGMKFGEEEPEEKLEDTGERFVNRWWCDRRGGYVHVFEDAKGKRFHVISRDYGLKSMEVLHSILAQMEVAFVQDHKAELVAMGKLKELIKPHLFAMYVLQGAFMETSPRSKVIYIFRRGRPTIALRPDKKGNLKILSILCMHGIGYYTNSFAGCLCATDDVIAHLVMMRANEHFFWRKANHHDAWDWRSGL